MLSSNQPQQAPPPPPPPPRPPQENLRQVCSQILDPPPKPARQTAMRNGSVAKQPKPGEPHTGCPSVKFFWGSRPSTPHNLSPNTSKAFFGNERQKKTNQRDVCAVKPHHGPQRLVSSDQLRQSTNVVKTCLLAFRARNLDKPRMRLGEIENSGQDFGIDSQAAAFIKAAHTHVDAQLAKTKEPFALAQVDVENTWPRVWAARIRVNAKTRPSQRFYGSQGQSVLISDGAASTKLCRLP